MMERGQTSPRANLLVRQLSLELLEFDPCTEGEQVLYELGQTKKSATDSSGESSEGKDSSGEHHPARRWVERTISWLARRRSLRIRWSKKVQNWLALIQLACAHVLLNLAVLG